MKFYIHRLDTSLNNVQLNAVFPKFIRSLFQQDIICESQAVSKEEISTNSVLFYTRPQDYHLLFLSGSVELQYVEEVKKQRYVPLIVLFGIREVLPQLKQAKYLPDVCVLPEWEVTPDLDNFLGKRVKLVATKSVCYVKLNSAFDFQQGSPQEMEPRKELIESHTIVGIEGRETMPQGGACDHVNSILSDLTSREIELDNCYFIFSAPLNSLNHSHYTDYSFLLSSSVTNYAEQYTLKFFLALQTANINEGDKIGLFSSINAAQFGTLQALLNTKEKGLLYIPGEKEAYIAQDANELTHGIVVYGKQSSELIASLSQARQLKHLKPGEAPNSTTLLTQELIQWSKSTLRAKKEVDSSSFSSVLAKFMAG